MPASAPLCVRGKLGFVPVASKWHSPGPAGAGSPILPQISISRTPAGLAREWGVDVHIETGLDIAPVPLDGEVQHAIREAAESLGLPCRRMPAMAGHDAQVVGRHAKAGMIFVPSRDGRSHSPLEFTSEDDVERGANVLLRTLLILAGKTS